MSKPFNMEIFLAGVLTGSHATRERHLRQAKAIQAAISDLWHRENPWAWQRKHLAWFLKNHLNQHAESTRYYYPLTMQLITARLGKPWQFKVIGAVPPSIEDVKTDHRKKKGIRQKRPNSGHSSRQATYISTRSALDSQNMTVHISELELRDDLPTLVFFGNAA